MAGNKSKPVIYWDACVFISLLTGDRPHLRADLKYWIDMAQNGEVGIVTSTITAVEILRFKHEHYSGKASSFFDRYVTRRSADHIVCELAHEIRNHVMLNEQQERLKRLEAAKNKAAADSIRKRKEVKPQEVAEAKKLSTEDAIHLATASIYNCDFFHTFDGDGFAKSRFVKLLSLDGKIPQLKARIETPKAPLKPDVNFDFFIETDGLPSR